MWTRITAGCSARGLWLCLLVFSVWAAGCGFETSADTNQGVCEADADCSGELICRSNFCSVPEGEFPDLRFRFLPANSSTLQPQTAEGITATPTRTMKFQLDSSILVEGRVTFAGVDTGPSGTLVFNARNGNTQRVTIGDQQSYQIWLRRDRYDVTFLPDDAADVQSRTRLDQSFIEGERRRFDFQLVAPDNLVQVRGRLIHGNQVTGCELSSGDIAPENALPGARIFAVSEDERFRSTVTTAGDAGQFTLRLPRDTGMYDLFVEAGDSPCVVPSLVERGAIDSSRTDVSRAQINVGPVPQEWINLESFTVRAPESVQTPEAWDEVTVELRAQLGRGTFRTQTRLTENGRIPASVPPALYTVYLTPPVDSPLAPTIRELTLSDELDAEPLLMDARRRVTGEITDRDSAPVSDAQVRLKPVEPPAGDRPTPVTARTNENGGFELWLNRGAYAGVVRPAATSGLPPRTLTIDPEQSDISVQLADPLVANGKVLRTRQESLAPVPNLTVEAQLEAGPYYWTLGQAQTDDQGQFSVVLPASDDG
jgi:hypothetical protein